MIGRATSNIDFLNTNTACMWPGNNPKTELDWNMADWADKSALTLYKSIL